MRKRILCVCPEVLAKPVERNLLEVDPGAKVFTYDYKTPIYYLSRFTGWRAPVRQSLRKNFNAQFRKAVSAGVANELLLVVAGMKLERKSWKALRRFKGETLLWYTDTVKRSPGAEKDAKLYDQVFYHDGADYDQSTHPGKKWVPYGFDSHYYKYQGEEKDVDILFTGYLKQPEYKTRLRYLRLLMQSDLPSRYKVVAAVACPDEKLEEEIRACGIEYLGRQGEKEYASWIKRSRIVVNIFQDDGGKPINPLFFAIPATGALQITGPRDYLIEWIEKGTETKMVCMQDFISILKQHLESPIQRTGHALPQQSFSSIFQNFGQR